MLLKVIKRLARYALERTNFGYRFLLKRDSGVNGPHGFPDAPWSNAVLKSNEEVKEGLQQVQRLRLPPVTDPPKNWDSLAGLDLVLRTTDRKARIFDAGGEMYSMILPWLFLYGYRNLIAGNLVFSKKIRKGPITYEYSDIINTRFPNRYFDAVTCLSVIEHGVDLNAYFREMARIIRKGGILITSADYYETPIDTRGQQAYGVPIHIFTKEEILQAVELATKRYGFSLVSPSN